MPDAEPTVARVLQRALLDPPIEHPRGRQELGEKHQLAVRRGRSLRIPAHVHAPAQLVDRQRRVVLLAGPNQPSGSLTFALTHRVSVPHRPQPAPPLTRRAITLRQRPVLG